MNMRVLKKSRKLQKPGDIFVLQMRDDEYIFGRVIRLDAVIGKFENTILAYIYRASSRRKDAIPLLNRDELLIPPLGVRREPWIRGYFETLAHRPLTEDDVLTTHCFWSVAFRKYFDDEGHELRARSEPCGIYALDCSETVDYAISKALGMPHEMDRS